MLITGIKNYTNNSTLNNWSRISLKFFLLSILIFWIFGFIHPTSISQNNSLTHYFLKRIYSRVCHQDISKCIIVDNESMLVCARCTGIYLGALISGLISLVNELPQVRIKTLLFASLPMFFDVLFTTIGIYTYSKTLAIVTGLIFGAVIYIFLINELEKFFSTKSIKRNEQ